MSELAVIVCKLNFGHHNTMVKVVPQKATGQFLLTYSGVLLRIIEWWDWKVRAI